MRYPASAGDVGAGAGGAALADRAVRAAWAALAGQAVRAAWVAWAGQAARAPLAAWPALPGLAAWVLLPGAVWPRQGPRQPPLTGRRRSTRRISYATTLTAVTASTAA